MALRSKYWAAVVAGALVVAACGSDDESTTTTDADAPTTVAAETTAAPDTAAPETDAPGTSATDATTAPADTTASTPAETTAVTEPPATDAPAPQGGDFQMVIGSEPAGLDPITGFVVDAFAATAMIERLIALDENLTPVEGGLVESWTQDDPVTWTFTIREGVTFHDGTPFDAEAAAKVLDILVNQTGRLKAFFARIASAEATDATTLVVTTAEPNNSVPALLSTAYVVQPDYYLEVGPEAFALNPVGTGPFMFDEWQPGQHLRAVRYDDYWRGPASLDSITWSFAAEGSTRANLLMTGDAHLVQNVPIAEQQDVEDEDGLSIFRLQTGAVMGIQINTGLPPLDDIRVREAIARAIDRDVIVEALFEGTGAVVHSGWYPTLFGTEFETEFPYSPDEAAALIEEVGDVTLDYWFTFGRYPNDSEVAEAVAGMLEEVGITVNRQPLEGGQFFPTKNEAAPGRAGVWQFAWVPVFPHPDVLFGAFVDDTASSKHFCPNPAYDAMGAEALAAETFEDAVEVYGQIEEQVINEDICFVSFLGQVLPYGISDSVSGFTPTPDELVDYYHLALNDD